MPAEVLDELPADYDDDPLQVVTGYECPQCGGAQLEHGRCRCCGEPVTAIIF